MVVQAVLISGNDHGEVRERRGRRFWAGGVTRALLRMTDVMLVVASEMRESQGRQAAHKQLRQRQPGSVPRECAAARGE